MKFETFSPCDLLKPYVKYLAISEASDEKPYKVLPDTSLVIGIQFKGKLSYLKDGKETGLSASGITGLMSSFRIFKNSGETGTVLIYFKDTGASAFFTEPLHEMFSQSLSLDNFIPPAVLGILEERLSESATDQQKINITEEFLISRLKIMPEDQLIRLALELIYLSSGTIRVSDLAKKLNISQSPLEKRFRKVVGASPKKFSTLVRLNSLIKSPETNRSLTEKGYIAGYYDQSHFIHDFKSFTGETPEAFFKEIKPGTSDI